MSAGLSEAFIVVSCQENDVLPYQIPRIETSKYELRQYAEAQPRQDGE